MRIFMGYVALEDLKVYRVAVELSDLGWKVYSTLDWKIQKIMGDQFIRSTDSVSANIAEGYGRYHHLDRIRFYYNARASLLESKHWANLLHKRGFLSEDSMSRFQGQANELHLKINLWIKSTRSSLQSSQNPP